MKESHFNYIVQTFKLSRYDGAFCEQFEGKFDVQSSYVTWHSRLIIDKNGRSLFDYAVAQSGTKSNYEEIEEIVKHMKETEILFC